MVYWARRLRRHTEGDILMISVDTDLVALAALHASARTWVCLHHRSAGTLAVDVAALAGAVTSRLGMSVPDFVFVCVSRGTDFTERAVRGAPAWGPYVRACADYLKTARAVIMDEECSRLDASAAVRMLRSAAVGKRASFTADQAWMRRALWTVAYWKRAPAGGGADVDPLCGRFGWEIAAQGAVVASAATLKGGIITIGAA